MKFMSKLQKKRDELKKDNNGFSLVELIIVIAIMAILVGIVGTQVIPYINKSKKAKDGQIVSSYSTAAVTAYSSNAAKITIPDSNKYDFYLYGSLAPTDDAKDKDAKVLAEAIKELTYTTMPKSKFASKEGKDADNIHIQYNFADGVKVVTAEAVKGKSGVAIDAAVSDL